MANAVDAENKLERCLAALPLLLQLSSSDSTNPVKVVAVGDAERRALSELVHWLSDLGVQDEEDSTADDEPGTSGYRSQRDMFDDYLLSFSRQVCILV
jgi:hypothetical protein